MSALIVLRRTRSCFTPRGTDTDVTWVTSPSCAQTSEPTHSHPRHPDPADPHRPRLCRPIHSLQLPSSSSLPPSETDLHCCLRRGPIAMKGPTACIVPHHAPCFALAAEALIESWLGRLLPGFGHTNVSCIVILAPATAVAHISCRSSDMPEGAHMVPAIK